MKSPYKIKETESTINKGKWESTYKIKGNKKAPYKIRENRNHYIKIREMPS